MGRTKSNLNAPLKRKQVILSSLKHLRNKTLDDLNSLDVPELKIRRNRFDKINDELTSVFNDIFELCLNEEIETFCDEREELFESLDVMVASIDRAIADCDQERGTLKTALRKSSDSVEVKLPVLSLPTFCGTSDEWLTFSDLFQAAVTNNTNLSGAQKLQYLKSSLKGDAQKIIQSIPISDENFKIAWDLLSERYYHKREILSALIKKIISMPSLSSESNSQLLRLVDSTKEYVRLLETLGLKLEGAADTIIMFLVQFKLDSDTRSWFERSIGSDRIPSLNELLQFLSNHARSVMTGNQVSKRTVTKRVSLVASKMQSQCPLCSNNHVLSKCEAFSKLSVQKRVEFVKTSNVCFNCLVQFHGIKTCKSKNKCRKCNKSHHTLLHFDTPSVRDEQFVKEAANSGELSVAAPVFVPNLISSSSGSNQTSQNSNVVGITSCLSNIGTGVQILLCTAIIKVKDSKGNLQLCRCLLDSGSQASLITCECSERLGLRKEKTNVLISCLGASDTRTSGVSQIQFTSHFPSQCTITTSVYVVNKIVGMLPSENLDSSYSEFFADLTLADPAFHKSGPVDILLGVDITLALLKGQTISMGPDKPLAIRSELGWVIGGKAASNSQPVFHVNNIQVVSDDLISKFWELDSVPCVKPLTSSERMCEEHFKETCVRNSDGRYTVRLPFHTSPTSLGNSRETALRRLIRMERHLSSNPEKYDQYRKFMNEYLVLNHMEPIPKLEYDRKDAYYLPHHAVLRDSSSTTKLRVVFDGSAKTSSGQSLNDLLMIGPRVQLDIFPILIKFRTFRIAVCADIEKMFRQIRVCKEDMDWQRILWRNSPEEDIREYRLATVTYGTSCAPFLSTRTLQQLALDEKELYPSASNATLHHFYVDDLLSGSDTREEAVQLVNELREMMSKGGFNLRKWRSNDPSIFSENFSESQDYDVLNLEDDGDLKVLGITWSSKSDSFKFMTMPVEIKDIYTKREILSQIARVFDPLGLVSPCVVFMKILLQKLWQSKIGWDQPISDELSRDWTSFLQEFHLLEKVTFPRYALQPNSDFELHAFCDSSERAYCAAIYIRSISSANSVHVSLLTSKTRVAPLKVQSLPRLELCAALLLTNLLKTTLKHLDIPIKSKYAWTDSKIALSWIASEPGRWQTFVANRVAQIQENAPDVIWKFVSGRENPADCGTRGISPSNLVNCDLWFNGPTWLRNSCISETEEIRPISEEMLKEEKKLSKVVVAQTINDTFLSDIFEKYSSWNKLKRVIGWCLRFAKNCSTSTEKRWKGFLTTEELNNAERIIVKHIQQTHFSSEISHLTLGKQLPSNSKILRLSPFTDNFGLLRVGGRLKNTQLLEEQKHPLLLPKSDHVVNLIIRHYHLMLMHAGPELLQASLREKYWILSARDAVRRVLRKCMPCFRNRPTPAQQIMGDLPEFRVCPSSVFSRVGTDFAGPLLIRSSKLRGSRTTKCYICVFVCLTTKAVHLEVVSDLSTKAFLACLRRFIARRGRPTDIFSDRGTNFRGASKQLTRELRELMKDDSVHNFLANENISWHFNPPSAPHFGGLWESVVKSFKFHLKRVVGNTSLTFEELATLTSQIEACLNSRPLCGMSSDPNDFSVLTPGHFITGRALTAVPERPILDSVTHLDRWRMLQRMIQHFWNRWVAEYLTKLQTRTKWRQVRQNLDIGDLVLIKNENLPPIQWKLGRIAKTFPGRDNKIRVVQVRTQNGELTRPITKLCPLPIS